MHKNARQALSLVVQAMDGDTDGKAIEAVANKAEFAPCTCLLANCGCSTLSQEMAAAGYPPDEIASALLDGVVVPDFEPVLQPQPAPMQPSA